MTLEYAAGLAVAGAAALYLLFALLRPERF